VALIKPLRPFNQVKPLLKQLTEVALKAELDNHNADDVLNHKNGKSRKKLKSKTVTKQKGSFSVNGKPTPPSE